MPVIGSRLCGHLSNHFDCVCLLTIFLLRTSECPFLALYAHSQLPLLLFFHTSLSNPVHERLIGRGASRLSHLSLQVQSQYVFAHNQPGFNCVCLLLQYLLQSCSRVCGGDSGGHVLRETMSRGLCCNSCGDVREILGLI